MTMDAKWFDEMGFDTSNWQHCQRPRGESCYVCNKKITADFWWLYHRKADRGRVAVCLECRRTVTGTEPTYNGVGK